MSLKAPGLGQWSRVRTGQCLEPSTLRLLGTVRAVRKGLGHFSLPEPGDSCLWLRACWLPCGFHPSPVLDHST